MDPLIQALLQRAGFAQRDTPGQDPLQRQLLPERTDESMLNYYGIYGARRPSVTNEYLTDQGVANDIRQRDLVINRPTQMPTMGYFPGEPGRFRSKPSQRQELRDFNLADQLRQYQVDRLDAAAAGRRMPIAPDVDITGTPFALTPADVAARRAQQTTLLEYLRGLLQ